MAMLFLMAMLFVGTAQTSSYPSSGSDSITTQLSSDPSSKRPRDSEEGNLLTEKLAGEVNGCTSSSQEKEPATETLSQPDTAANYPPPTKNHFVHSPGNVIAPAPDVIWHQGNKIEHLSSLRGKPVLILITDSPRNHAFVHQLNELRGHYERLAAHNLICLVAFTQQAGTVPSNIPFITLLDGTTVAKSYGISTHFGLALLGADGNLDCQSTRPLSGQRIDDLMNASYTTQEAMRRP